MYLYVSVSGRLSIFIIILLLHNKLEFINFYIYVYLLFLNLNLKIMNNIFLREEGQLWSSGRNAYFGV